MSKLNNLYNLGLSLTVTGVFYSYYNVCKKFDNFDNEMKKALLNSETRLPKAIDEAGKSILDAINYKNCC